MSPKNLPLIFLLCLAPLSLAALPAEGQAAGEELVAALKEEMTGMAVGEDAQDLQAARQYLRQLQNALGQESPRQMDQILDNFGNYQPSAKVLTCVEALRKSIKEGAERKTRALVAELEGLLATAAETVTRAEEPVDLDKVLEMLSQNRFNNGGGENEGFDSANPAIRAKISAISAARQFVTNWQDYLQASNAGNTSQALQALRNLSSQEISLIPRSQIIARVEFEQASEDEIAKILEGMTKPEDIKEGLRKLMRLAGGNRSSSSDNVGPREILQALGRLEKCYREFLAGLPVKVEVLQPQSESLGSIETAKLIELRAAILLLVLPRALDLPAEFSPTGGETVDGFLSRAMTDATRRDDLGVSLRIAELRQLLASSANFSDKDTEALRQYAAGRNQATAGQYLLAVVSLQNALKSGSQLVPPEKTGALLETIRKEHPEEFSQGMTEFLTPRSTPEFDYSRMPFRGYRPPHGRFPDSDPRQGGTTIVLPVPARETEKPDATKREDPPKAPDKPAPKE